VVACLFVEAGEREKEHFTCILLIFLKTYKEKFLKMSKMTEIPLKVKTFTQKLPPNRENDQNDKKSPVKVAFL
jgi:hypothetical protein